MEFFSSVKLRRGYRPIVSKGRVSGFVCWNVDQALPSYLSSLITLCEYHGHRKRHCIKRKCLEHTEKKSCTDSMT